MSIASKGGRKTKRIQMIRYSKYSQGAGLAGGGGEVLSTFHPQDVRKMMNFPSFPID